MAIPGSGCSAGAGAGIEGIADELNEALGRLDSRILGEAGRGITVAYWNFTSLGTFLISVGFDARHSSGELSNEICFPGGESIKTILWNR